MPSSVDPLVSLRAQQIQNEYAYAIDTRDWELFRTLFADDVRADYPHNSYNGLEEWLTSFIPLHDTFGWTRHEMTNHIAGRDGNGVWAACYGFIEWVPEPELNQMTTARAIYRDRLRQQGGEWVITRRALTVTSVHPQVQLPESMRFPHALHELGQER